MIKLSKQLYMYLYIHNRLIYIIHNIYIYIYIRAQVSAKRLYIYANHWNFAKLQMKSLGSVVFCIGTYKSVTKKYNGMFTLMKNFADS